MLEPGWACSDGDNNVSTPQNCSNTCGNGLIDSGEACDLAALNQVAPAYTSGCTTTCQIEPGWYCTGTVCETICGDGIQAGTEKCDDMTNNGKGGCKQGCANFNDGWLCNATLGLTTSCTPICDASGNTADSIGNKGYFVVGPYQCNAGLYSSPG